MNLLYKLYNQEYSKEEEKEILEKVVWTPTMTVGDFFDANSLEIFDLIADNRDYKKGELGEITIQTLYDTSFAKHIVFDVMKQLYTYYIAGDDTWKYCMVQKRDKSQCVTPLSPLAYTYEKETSK